MHHIVSMCSLASFKAAKLDLPHADFLRVGSLPRIHKAVLPHSLHATSAEARAKKGGAAAELKDMLARATSPSEASIIRYGKPGMLCRCGAFEGLAASRMPHPYSTLCWRHQRISRVMSSRW
jgi:hypothetical protein